MKQILLPALVMFSLAAPVMAKDISCSIRPGKQLSEAEFSAMTKITPVDAEKAAIAKVDTPAATVTKSKLEVKDECLVYMFDIKIPDKTGVERVLIDAGTGEVLLHEHESATMEMLKDTKDKMLNKE